MTRTFIQIEVRNIILTYSRVGESLAVYIAFYIFASRPLGRRYDITMLPFSLIDTSFMVNTVKTKNSRRNRRSQICRAHRPALSRPLHSRP